MNGPNFLCIGAQKAGTTWLQKALEAHPDVFLPRKEIHFFDRDVSYPSPNFLAESDPLRRILKKENWARNIQIVRALVKSAATLNTDRCRFFAKFFLTIDEQWYAGLFRTNCKYKAKGDITPSYSILSRDDVRKIRTMNPEMKIIFIMRNPISRDWSAYRYHVMQLGYTINPIEYFSCEGLTLRGDYLRTIDNYSTSFPENQILYCFFDELIEAPQNFYDRICRFLGISPRNDSLVTEKINQSPDLILNEDVKLYLTTKHLSQLEKLAEKFGGYCKNWYEEARMFKNRHPEIIETSMY